MIEEDGFYMLVVDVYLFLVLSCKEKVLMCEGECYCLIKFNNGGFRRVVNIMNCKCIELVKELYCFDIEGIMYYVIVFLEGGDRRFGLLNVVVVGKIMFDEEELYLFEFVVF